MDGLKKEREKQVLKDNAMSSDCDFCLIVWDGKSKGSYFNILRAIEFGKKTKVYVDSIGQFLDSQKITENDIESIYRDSNGYSAAEVVEYFEKEGNGFFSSTRELNKILMDRGIIKKIEGVYHPVSDYGNLFIVKKYRGRITGINFNDKFIDWVDCNLCEERNSDLKQMDFQFN